MSQHRTRCSTPLLPTCYQGLKIDVQLRKNAGDLHRVGDEGLPTLTSLPLVGSKTHGQRGTHHLSSLPWQIVQPRRQTLAPQKVAGDLSGRKFFVELQAGQGRASVARGKVFAGKVVDQHILVTLKAQDGSKQSCGHIMQAAGRKSIGCCCPQQAKAG